MSVADLLPSNATQLERDLSRSGDVVPRLGPGVERIRDAKFNDIPDQVVPWLIYEYGLGEITPYVPNLRQALAEGIQWQRVRGTRQAIDIGLGWIGFDATVEESEAGTLRWADFQMGLDQAPNGLDFTNNVIQISRLSAPIRSRLFRIYGGYDYRRFRLDDHLLSGGSWLADDTGVYLRPDWPQLSFGREFQTAADFLADAVNELAVERTRTDGGIYEDRNILSNSHLSDLLWRTWHMDVARVTVSRGHLTVVGPWWQTSGGWGDYSWDQGLDWAGLVNRIQPALKFAKAGLYLSDGAVLGDTNACFPARLEEEMGDGPLLLSEADYDTGEGVLSQHVSRFEFQEWNERVDRIHTATGIGFLVLATGWDQVRWLDGAQWQPQPISSDQLHRVHTTATEDRQGVAERLHVRTLQGATLALFTFYDWADPITWNAEAELGWSGGQWPDSMWIEGNAYWNPSSPLIESQHETLP